MEIILGAEDKTLSADLRAIPVFSDLSGEQLAWIAAHCEEIRIEPGEAFIREGEPANWLAIILEGDIRIQRENVQGSPVFTAVAGQVTGFLPYSRLTHYGGTGRAVTRTRMARLHKDHIPEMLRRMPELGQRLVAIMADRIRETMRLETQRDKLMALGKLSAGLAHELNNPAAAALRAATTLRETLETVRAASLRLIRHPLSAEQREFILSFEREAAQPRPTQFDPLALSDCEDRITGWLEAHGVVEAWKVASSLAESGVDIPKLESLVSEVGEAALADLVTRISSLAAVARLVGEIETSARRISDLVKAIKEYSYMDQAPLQEIDLHQGIENTLTILGHRLKKGVTVVREYDPDIPKVCAYGGELNQIWTNLIDNAIDAMEGRGTLRVRTARALDRVLVEIGDDGPGIPQEMQSRIFEPFFTTKGVGQGTGLGLDTVCRIVRNHHGEIRVTSKPGDTRFEVYLPIAQPRTQ